MNWVDYLILAIIVVSVLYGAARGLIHSIFKLVGLIGSIVITKLYYVFVTEFLIEYTGIVGAVSTFVSNKSSGGESLNMGLLEGMALPAGILIEKFSEQIVAIIVNCIGLLATFAVVRLCITLLELLLKEAFKLPVLNTINYTGGAILGLVESILILLVVFALTIPFSALGSFSYINSSIGESVLAKYFYSYNFILSWIVQSALSILLH